MPQNPPFMQIAAIPGNEKIAGLPAGGVSVIFHPDCAWEEAKADGPDFIFEQIADLLTAWQWPRTPGRGVRLR